MGGYSGGMVGERLITQNQWQDKCRELRVKTDLLRSALEEIAIQSASIKRLEGVVMEWQVKYADAFELLSVPKSWELPNEIKGG